MHIEAQGIIIYPSELRALVKFAAKDAENPLSVVHFRSEGSILYAYATSGHRAVEARGVASQGAIAGEWTVAKAFLATGLKMLEKGQMLVLEVSGASLQGAVVRDAKTLEDVSELTWPTDAASTQTSFPVESMRKVIELPTTTFRGRCISINGQYLAELTLICDAADSDALDLFPGKTREDPLTFRIEETDTEWRGAIAPLRKTPSETDDTPPKGIFNDNDTISVVTEHGEVVESRIVDLGQFVQAKKDAAKARAKAAEPQPDLGFEEPHTDGERGDDE